jgi:hypothetical protein
LAYDEFAFTINLPLNYLIFKGLNSYLTIKISIFVGDRMRDFPIPHRQIPGPGQTLLAALPGARSAAQTVHPTSSADLVLRVLRPQGARHQNLQGHSQLLGRFRAIAFHPPAIGACDKQATRATPSHVGWDARWPWGHSSTWVLSQRRLATVGCYFHAWTS